MKNTHRQENNRSLVQRRDFIRQTSLLGSAALVMPSLFGRDTKKSYKMGLQLFTMRADMGKDPVGSLKKIAAIGYQDLETYGYDPVNNKYYGMAAGDFKKVLEDNNLTTSSGHYDFAQYLNKPQDDLKKYLDECIAGAHATGQKYITWPWLSPDSRSIDSFRLLSGKLNLMGEQVKKAGLTLAYHNHDFEFTEHDGKIGYDIILKETDPELVKLQMDLFWVAHSSKRSPHELFTLQPGRFVMWHIKDMSTDKRYTELGNGTIDFTKIMPDMELAGMQYYFVEQGDYFKTSPFQSITDSAAYVKKHLGKWLG